MYCQKGFKFYILFIFIFLVACGDSTNTVNRTPVAIAGDALSASLDERIVLDGSSSFDPDGDELTYSWSFIQIPDGSTATIENNNNITSSFVADRSGEYIVSLIVSDGLAFSSPSVKRITISNSSPIANAGSNQKAVRDQSVVLNGSSSIDPDDNAITYQWLIVEKPAGSIATLSDSTVVDPSFIPDVIGSYLIELVVSDGDMESVPDQVRVNVDTVVVYANDFSNPVLDDFLVSGIDPANVRVVNGELLISLEESSLSSRASVSLNLTALSADINARLSGNPAKIHFMFNVSTVDSDFCGSCNNAFSVNLFSKSSLSDTTGYGYSFQGGGFVQNRMLFLRQALFNSPYGNVYEIIADIENGLAPFPMIGAFKLSYDPELQAWEIYFEQNIEAINPANVSSLIGTYIDSSFTNDELPYFVLGANSGKSTVFDNLSITMEFALD